MAHSLLFVTAHPLVISVGHFVLKLFKVVKSFPSIGEGVGSVFGFVGLAITLLDVTDQGQVTVVGDMTAFVGAGTI